MHAIPPSQTQTRTPRWTTLFTSRLKHLVKVAGVGIAALVLSACATTTPLDALQVNVVGVALNLELRGHDFANGVSNQVGTIPRFGEALVVVPVSVSATAMVRQIYALAMGERGAVNYVARGKLSGTGVMATRFETKGQMQLPAGLGLGDTGTGTGTASAPTPQPGAQANPLAPKTR